MNPTSNNFLKGLRENWFLILFIGGLIMAWTTFKNRVDYVEAAQADQKTEIMGIKTEQQELRTAVIESKASFIFIKESIAELKARK